MLKKSFTRKMLAVAIISAGLSSFTPVFAAGPANGAHPAIHVDIPIRLKQANVVFNMDHLAFAGDIPVGIHYMHLLAKRYVKDRTKGKIIGVFHGAAAYMTLNDKAYNAYRHISTGNPYKGAIAELLKQGVQVEECAVSMKGHHWKNDNLLPGVKVNAGAVARLIELVQEGYVQLQP